MNTVFRLLAPQVVFQATVYAFGRIICTIHITVLNVAEVVLIQNAIFVIFNELIAERIIEKFMIFGIFKFVRELHICQFVTKNRQQVSEFEEATKIIYARLEFLFRAIEIFLPL